MSDAAPLTPGAPVGILKALGAATLVAEVIAPGSVPAAAPVRAGVTLTATEAAAPAGGIALILGPSMISTPSQQYADTVEKLYLAPNGFTGETQVLTTPESPYYLDSSEDEGAKILTAKIQSLIDAGQVNAENPVTVFGYSQSAALTTLAMQQLHAAGVPSEDVHFVLVGDSANPNGGMLIGFENLPGLSQVLSAGDVTLGNPTPNDLYPTDIYTLEYDGYADFPRYPVNLLSDLNALMGLTTQHLAYLGLTADQIADATPLQTAADGMIHSYMISSEYLPLLVPVLLMPVIGKPLYDLMEPDMRILVNLGYGDMANGWNDGPADVATPFSLAPPTIDWTEVSAALEQGAKDGYAAFTADLANPATYQVGDLTDNPALAHLMAAAAGAGIVENAQSMSLSEVIGAFLHTISGSLSGAGVVAPGSALADLESGDVWGALLASLGLA
ncbi:PE-PPE domain-containing protein [Mycobacterium sp. M1]|uniref:PE-PPE domain-containing protein n=1 Tax=Mycolicibacter acidiphilus TaxID=2835306 RepID=A0ABS5RLJ8_9MYCO|nr:PE-PPE domain-containing protein [Mycolicibacter acidiphilus]MBS9535186.1 PE-PPE domain-containing protein [Mycolicibacter acidiphilus]